MCKAWLYNKYLLGCGDDISEVWFLVSGAALAQCLGELQVTERIQVKAFLWVTNSINLTKTHTGVFTYLLIRPVLDGKMRHDVIKCIIAIIKVVRRGSIRQK